MSPEEFTRAAADITNHSDVIMDGWQISYAVYNGLGVKEGNDCYIHKSVSNAIEGDNTISADYHVAYNMSYGVPVICFNLFRSDGTMLKPEEALHYCCLEKTDEWKTTVTQLDHPVLKRPFLTLHPCETERLIDNCFATSANPLVSWLSSVSCIVGLKMPMSYAELTVPINS